MARYTVKTYERRGIPADGAMPIDISTFEAASDEDAKLQARSRSLLSVRGEFANLLSADEKIIWVVERSNALRP